MSENTVNQHVSSDDSEQQVIKKMKSEVKEYEAHELPPIAEDLDIDKPVSHMPTRSSSSKEKNKRQVADANSSGKVRVTATLPRDTFEDLKHLSDKEGVSINNSLMSAVIMYLDIKHGCYPDNMDLMTNRLNEIVTHLQTLESTVAANQESIALSLKSLLALTNGDNYLLSDYDGDLDS